MGALLAGALADLFGMTWSIGAVAALTFFSGLLHPVSVPSAPDATPVVVRAV